MTTVDLSALASAGKLGDLDGPDGLEGLGDFRAFAFLGSALKGVRRVISAAQRQLIDMLVKRVLALAASRSASSAVDGERCSLCGSPVYNPCQD